MLKRWAKVWGYLIEAVCASVLYLLIVVWLSAATITSLIQGGFTLWTTLCGFCFTCSAAALGLVYSQASSDFGRYLSSRDAAQLAYAHAFRYSILISATGAIVCILAGTTKNDVVAQVAAFFIIYSVLQIITVSKNLYELMWLHDIFLKESEKFRRESLAVMADGGTSGENGNKKSKKKKRKI